MNDEIQSLLDSLRRGQYEDPAEKIALLAAALHEGRADEVLLESLLRAPQISLRLAALEACRLRRLPALDRVLVTLAVDAESRVRRKLVECLEHVEKSALEEILLKLVEDPEPEVRVHALKSSEGRKAFLGVQAELLANDAQWAVRAAAAKALGSHPHPQPVACVELLRALANDSDSDVREECAKQLDRQLVRNNEVTVSQLPTAIDLLSKAEAAVAQMGGRFQPLLDWLRSHTEIAISPQELAKFGADLTALAEAKTLPRAHHVESFTAMLIDMLQRERRRSIVLIGKSGCGKSALVNELVYALALPENGGWRVVRVSPADLTSGTKYLGEWETKVKELVAAIKRPRRVLLYVTSLGYLSSAGRTVQSDFNIAAALAPYLDDGSIVILGESSPEEFERGLGREPTLVRLFDKVLVEESSKEQTEAVLRAIRSEGRGVISDDRIAEIMELSGFFLGHLARPGNGATLLRSILAWAQDTGREVTRLDILNVISQSTGLPVQLLDDGSALDQAELRGFFEKQIIGQPEAIDAVVDVVTLIKAGLTDPNRPFNVMLFVGPTGVGKTELARSLAEYIFGDPVRLLRFDMSEFAAAEGFARLIGSREENGLLTDAVRQRPFSVLLLDEIEKSHINVFDLCLQIFDAGRLTDGRGRLVDFRRTVVILTSNIGSEGPGLRLGFGASGTELPAPVADPDRTLRELSRFFRPEFLNRIDRIVSFRPLSLEVAERIARRELQLVLQRSGVARRGLAVNTDPSVISLLVREGYSPHFGARPLKRTVERHILLPLARFLAGARGREHAVLSLAASDNKVEVRVISEPLRAPKAPAKSGAQEKSADRSLGELANRMQGLDARLEALQSRKSELAARTRQPGFFDQHLERDAVFDELHRLDEFLARCAALHEGVDRFVAGAAGKTSSKGDASVIERRDELLSELEQLEFVSSARDASMLGDALISISLVKAEGEPLDAVRKLAETYRHMASRRRLQAEVIAERWDDSVDEVHLKVPGLGALALFSGESGLHEFNFRKRVKNPRSGREQTHKDSSLVRVEVFGAGSDPDKSFTRAVEVQVKALKPQRSRLIAKAGWSVRLFHPVTVRSVEAWSHGTKDDVLSVAMGILFAHVRAADQSKTAATKVIRRYDLGIGSQIKDLRTGKITTRLAQFFGGRVELSLVAPAD